MEQNKTNDGAINKPTTNPSQATTPDLVVIERAKFARLMGRLCQAQYMVIIMSAVGYVQNMEFTMTPEDVSELLGIDWPTFQRTLIRTTPKSTRFGNNRVYSIESMARVAEIATRPQRMKHLTPTPAKK